jgi:valyl-tRNA synthetase
MAEQDALPKQYDPKAAQSRWLEFWDKQNLFHSEPDPKRKPYTIVIPPPNVTGALHMGHALNNTLQDVLIRWRRAQGYNAEWLPGTDHAGIATQAVVERRIKETENKTRRDLGREELVRRIWEWKDQYEKRILGQLRQLGCSCDWPRTRFTMDEGLSRAVRTTFFNWFREGYIYRGKRLVNWDTSLQTSVADDETYTEDVPGGFWTFKYPVNSEKKGSAKGSMGSDEGPLRPVEGSLGSVGGPLASVQSQFEAGSGPEHYIRFSTTRPETMLGDTAVCVHPNDDRYKHLIGKTVHIPLVSRDIPIIADGQLADPTLGTGCVKVTPAHDPNDYACYTRHPEIGIINILNPDGTINENGGKYEGLDRYKAREQVVADMEALGLFEGREDRTIPLKYSDRSKTPIEPYLSDQWFVKMGDRDDGKPGLAQMSMDAVTSGRVKFFPERYAKTYLDWLGEKRDWCISRQLWWGHRIPVWHLVVGAPGASRLPLPSLEKALQGYCQLLRDENLAVDEIETRLWGEGNTFYICARTQRAESVLQNLEALVVQFNGTEPSDNAVAKYGAVGPSYKKAAIGIVIRQDPDVLDTWFSSQLWPHSTFGWPEETPDLRYYYPTSTLVTSRDIITLWVARMVLSGLYNMHDVPFREVYITPKLLDGFGETMSKSKGNGVDPLDIIDRYGADALRFVIVGIATETQDAKLPVSNACPHCDTLVPVKHEHMYMRTRKIVCPNCKKPFRPGGPWPAEDPELPTARQASEKFEQGRNFANKLWNAARFLLMNLDGYTPGPIDIAKLPVEDRWILSRMAATTAAVTEQLEGYHFADVARTLYEFTWSEYCDWYVEMSKNRLKNPLKRVIVQSVLVGILDAIVRLIQPVMPFLAESIWQALNEAAPERGLPKPEKAAASVCVAPWPSGMDAWREPATETSIGRMQNLISGIREVRNHYMVDPKSEVSVRVRCDAAVALELDPLYPFIQQLAGVGSITCGPDAKKPSQSAGIVRPEFEAYVSLAGLIDVAKEIERSEKLLAEKRKHLAATQAKLANAGFVGRAPAEVVQQQRDLVAELAQQIQTIEADLKELKQ